MPKHISVDLKNQNTCAFGHSVMDTKKTLMQDCFDSRQNPYQEERLVFDNLVVFP